MIRERKISTQPGSQPEQTRHSHSPRRIGLIPIGLMAAVLIAAVTLIISPMLAPQAQTAVAQDSPLALDKSVSGLIDDGDNGSQLGLGDAITYTFTITNTGDALLDSIALDDEMLGLEGAICGELTLEPGEFTSCMHIYIITGDDVAAGWIENQAVATGIDPNGEIVSAQAGVLFTGIVADDDEVVGEGEAIAEDEEVIEIPQNPALALDKSFTGFIDMDDNDELSLDDVISYTFTITNTGNVTLGQIALSDEMLGLEEVVCEESSLAPEVAASCVFTYIVTEEDMLAGEIYNQAVVTGIAPNEEEVMAEADETVEIPHNPALALDKSFTGFIDMDDNDELSLGDIVTYSFTITNTGNVLLDPVTLDDEKLELEAVTCGQSSLAPGESASCEHTYTITQDDVDAGEVHNHAVVTGVAPTQNDEESNEPEE